MSLNTLDSRELDARLERWSNWARGPQIGSMMSAEGYMKEHVDPCADSAEMTDEIAITERALARTKLEEKAYWRVISRYYLGRLSLIEIALFFHKPESRIKSLFSRAKSRVGEHIATLEGMG